MRLRFLYRNKNRHVTTPFGRQLPLWSAAGYAENTLLLGIFKGGISPHLLTSRPAKQSEFHKSMASTSNLRSAFAAPIMKAPQPYTPPPFASKIAARAPAHRLHLAMCPTPIQPWDLHAAIPDLPQHLSFHIKRDDMTGITTSGNKIRKLEFLLADALANNCDTIITAGGVQSNHARASAVAAKELGMDAHVFLRTRDYDKPQQLGADGNVLMHKMLGAEIHLVPRVSYLAGILPKMNSLAERLRGEGRHPYLIGIGGSNEIGLWGYIEAFSELMNQGVCDNFTDVVVAVGSGGTASGLAIGNYLSGSRVRVHAVAVCDTPAYFHGHLDEMLDAVGLKPETSAPDILNIIDAKGLGYARNTDEELELAVQVSRATGIMLDPVYTLKGVYGLAQELRKSDNDFKSDAKILFIHTGGLFGLYDRRIEPFLNHSLTKTWKN